MSLEWAELAMVGLTLACVAVAMAIVISHMLDRPDCSHTRDGRGAEFTEDIDDEDDAA